MVVGDRVSDQVEDNPYFEAMVTRAEFEILADRRESNSLKDLTHQTTKDEHRIIRVVPRGMLISEDGYSLTDNLPNKKRFLKKLKKLQEKKPDANLGDVVQSHQVRYGVKQRRSKYNGLEITGDIIEDAIFNKLKKIRINDKVYTDYKNWMIQRLDEDNREKTEEINKLTFRANKIRGEFQKYISKHMSLEMDTNEKKIYEDKKKEYEAKLSRLDIEINDIKGEERNLLIETEAFCRIMNNIADYYKKGSYVQKARIAKIFFSNIVIDKEKRLHIAVKPLFQNILDSDLSNGADDGTRTRNQQLGRLGL